MFLGSGGLLGKRFLFCVLSFSSLCAASSDPRLTGRVTDENEAPLAGARVTVRPAAPPSTAVWSTRTDPAGTFSLTLPAPGSYLIDVQREGYYEMKDRPIRVENALDLSFALGAVREVFQSVNVNERPSPVDIAQTESQERLTGTEVNDIPYPNSHSLRNSMKLLPGVVEDAAGGMHFNGSSENQVQYVLNGFNMTDPISGQFRTLIPVEGVRSVDYSSGRYSPEFGKGTAGVLTIRTDNGTDAFHYSTTDFIPGLQAQQGVRLGNWYPRLNVTGPIVRGRAWFADTFQLERTSALITGLPSGQNTRTGWAGSNLVHTQINATPRNIVYADFLSYFDHEDRAGLGVLDPVSTTRTVRGREYFGGIKDQLYLGGSSLIEFGYAHNAFSTIQTPQAQGLYVFSPQGRGGNYFVTSDQASSRDQALVHAYAPAFQLGGAHQFEAGAEADLLHYDGNFRRTGYELAGIGGQLLTATSFAGPGLFHVNDTEAGSWLLDTWRISKRLQLNAGFRQDWDRLVHDIGWSPRISFSWAPFRAGHTRVAGGYAATHDTVPLDPFGRVLDQSALTTAFDPSGRPLGPPALTTFTQQGGLKLPYASNWTLDVDHEITPHVVATAKYLRRRGTDGFTFLNAAAPDAPPSLLPLPNGVSAGTFQLANLRRDDYDSVQMTVRQQLHGQYEWMASYTRSRAQSNAVLDANTSVPLQVLPALVPMPWDSPNRVVGWTYLPLWWKDWALAALVDARSGFPFSVQQQTGIVSGPVNSYRYPFNMDVDLSLERMITLLGYRFALRGGVNNLTNHKNPTAVYNVIGSPRYLQFLGFEGRHFVVRVRFFGRAGAK